MQKQPGECRVRSVLSPSGSFFEWAILVLVGLASWLGVWLFGGVRLWSVGPLMAAVFLATALYGLRAVWRPQHPLRTTPGLLFFTLFLLYAGMLIPRAAVPYDAHLEVLKWASYVCAYWVWSQLAGAHGRWRWLVGIFFVVVTMMAWYAIIQHAHGSRMVLTLARPNDYGMRASGAYFCPNHFANLLAMTVPFALAVALAPSSGLPLRLLAGYSMLLALPPLYLTQSRSGWIGVLAGLSVTIALLGLRRSFRRFLLLAVLTPLVLAALAGLVWAFSPMVQARVADALAGNVRLQLWQDTWSMIKEQPWLGWGPYSYRWVYPKFWHFMTVYVDPQFAHNDYLQLWAEYGLAGIVLLLGACGVAITRFLVKLPSAEGEGDGYLLAGLMGAIAATGMHALFDYNFHIYGNVQTLVMLAGLVSSVALGSGHRASLAPRGTLGALLLSGAALSCLLMLGLTIRAVASYAFVLKGDAAREVFEMDRAQSRYEWALRMAPANWNAHLGLGQSWGAMAFWNRDPESRAGQIERAMAHYQHAREGNAWDTDAQFGLSRMYNAQGQTDSALQVLQHLVSQAPHHRDFQVQLGLQLRQMGRDKESLEVFRKVRSLGPSETADLNIQSLTRKIQERGVLE